MKIFPAVFLACMLSISSFAQDSKTNATAKSPSGAGITLQPSSAVITAPLVLTNGAISQPERTDLPEGGKAVYTFTITNAGNYLIKGLVNAPDEESNSFYVNVDAQPEDQMIWDIEVTTGFQEQTVNWRGDGDPGSGQTKKFNLSAGDHKLIIMGREPAQLKSISIVLAN